MRADSTSKLSSYLQLLRPVGSVGRRLRAMMQ